MTEHVLMYACLFLGLSAALIAGVFQSFSDFVMRGLGTAPGDGGMASMQRINVTVMRSWFLASFLVLIPATIGLAFYASVSLHGAVAAAIIVAGWVYVVGAFGVTMLGNVPMNNRLARLPLQDGESYEYWQHYLAVWTRFNHLRLFACIVSSGCYLYAAILLAGHGG